MIKPTYRQSQAFIFLLSLAIFCLSLYLEWVKNLLPCPLCLMQRLFVACIAAVALFAWVVGKKHAVKTTFILQLILSLLGAYFASRQLWLMQTPTTTTEACLPGLDMMFRYFSLQDTLRALFLGSASCGENVPNFAALPMPIWSLVYFAGVFVFSIFTRTIKESD